jgi:SAM-dependent methyltransferase
VSWAVAKETGATYDPTFFGPLFAIEDRHFWFRTRELAITRLVGSLTSDLAPGYRVLEVGCGTGHVLRALESVCTGGTVVGFEGLAFARTRTRCDLVQGDVRQPPFRVPFELVGAFDVLEHLDDDVGALRDLRALLATDGALLLSVPAHPQLWSYFDDAAQHKRRYTRAELARKVGAAGLRIVYLSHYMASLVPLVWLGRRLAGALGGRRGDPGRGAALTVSEFKITPVVNDLLAWVLRRELELVGRGRLPVGTSLIAVARRAS